MGFMDWMKSGKSKGKDVNVTKIKDQVVGEMAAGNQTAASAAIVRMMEQKNATPKILMVQDGDYLPQVTDYALKMAQRLDCEIIALDVSDMPLQFASGDRRDFESSRFFEKARESAANFTMRAEAQGVTVKHIMEIAKQEDVIARLSSEDAGIRYVLTKPDQESLRADQRTQVPVFDLNCSRLER